jgi:hypothetical protein
LLLPSLTIGVTADTLSYHSQLSQLSLHPSVTAVIAVRDGVRERGGRAVPAITAVPVTVTAVSEGECFSLLRRESVID